MPGSPDGADEILSSRRSPPRTSRPARHQVFDEAVRRGLMPELVGADTALGGRGRRTGLARTPRGEFAAGG